MRDDKNKRAEGPSVNADKISEADGILEGRNPVLEALSAGRALDRLFVASGTRDAALSRIVAKAKAAGAVVVEVSRSRLDEMSATRSHQGVIATMPAREYVDIEDVFEKIAKSGKNGKSGLLVILDGITDPQNLGAVIRSAEAAGADAVIVPKRRSAGLTAAVSKASAGALEHMSVARVANITQLIARLKKQGFWVFGASGAGETPLYDADFKTSAAVVIGSEGEGLSRLVSESCDLRLKIPMLGKVSSLNAAAAAAVILYEAVRQRIG